MTKFEVGKKYYQRSEWDYNRILDMEVIKRTEKSVTVLISGTKKVNRRIFTVTRTWEEEKNTVECFNEGRILWSADDIEKPKTEYDK